MDQDTADAISIIEKQMAEMKQKISAMDIAFKRWNDRVDTGVATLHQLIDVLEKGFGK